MNVEPVEEFLDRVQPKLPNFPESVWKQWIYRHYSDAVSMYGWLGFEGLTFELQTLRTAEIFGRMASFPDESLIPKWTRLFKEGRYSLRSSWLGKYMIEAGT